jgi:hypothetical protein
LFKGRFDFKQYIPKKQAFWHQNLQSVWRNWLHIRQESIRGEGKTAKGARCDRNTCNSVRTDTESTRTWPQIVHGQLFFFPSTIPRLGQETNLLLWHCQTQQERHATGHRPTLLLRWIFLMESGVYILRIPGVLYTCRVNSGV